MKVATAREGKAKGSKDERTGQEKKRELDTHTACKEEAHGEGKAGERRENGQCWLKLSRSNKEWN